MPKEEFPNDKSETPPKKGGSRKGLAADLSA
jgi:hypothetical protein